MSEYRELAKKVVSALNELEQGIEENKVVKIPNDLLEKVVDHKKAPLDLMNEVLDKQILIDVGSSDKEIKSDLAKVGSRLNSDVNKIKIEMKSLVNSLVELNSELKKPAINLDTLRDLLTSIENQTKDLKNVDLSALILNKNESMSDEIISHSKIMKDLIGTDQFQSSLEKMIDLVMDYSKSLKAESAKAEESHQDLADQQFQATIAYKALVEELGLKWD